MNSASLWTIFRAAALAALFGTIPWVAAGAAQSEAVTPQVTIDRPVVLASDGAPIYVLVRFAALEEAAHDGRPRPPVNLALVLDRSGSMEDKGKLEYLKVAARTVVDALGADDLLAVVEYDDYVTVMWPSAPVEARGIIKRQIADLFPRGATDLVGGMMAGAKEVRSHLDGEAVNRVLLLSDGLANRGVTEPWEVARLVREARKKGVRISTLGLGLDYNEDLMQAIAESGGGHYYFIEHPNQMAGIFQRELTSLFSTIARDVDFRFEADSAVDGLEVYGFVSETAGGTTRVELEDFYAGETRSILLRFDARHGDVGKLPLGTLEFSYLDVESGARRTFSTELAVTVSDDPAEVEHAANSEVEIEAALVEAERGHADVVRLYEDGDEAAAERGMETLIAALRTQNEALGDVRIDKKIEALEVENADIQAFAAAPSPEESAGYVKRSKQRLYEAQSGQRALYLLQEGDEGFEVERLQEALRDSGHYAGLIGGKFSKALAAALRDFQEAESISADGIAGPMSLKLLGLY